MGLVESRGMTPAHAETSSGRASREAAVVICLTILGAVLRLWGVNHLGLVHFDEGIYVIAGLWSLSPRGLSALDPTLIAYAPPGFPYLVGIAYLFLGISDVTAILVSVLAGVLTIPAAAWLARRTFGAGAGAGAAALVALSGFHVAYSRMALTDASFLLCWVLGLICAQRFLERPGFASAAALGLSVGVSQLFKYNGWMIGAIATLAAVVGVIVDPLERRRARIFRIWALGLLAAFLSAVIYWPWFQFVDVHGGYWRLVAHHQGYVGGPGSWLPHLRLQLDQIVALSGGPIWTAVQYLAAVASCTMINSATNNGYIKNICAILLGAVLVASLPHAYWWIVGLWFLPGHMHDRPSKLVLGLAWLGLSIATPFYHPYARLWLPLHLLGCAVMGEYIRFSLAGTAPENGLSSKSPLREAAVRIIQICFSLILLTILMFPPEKRLILFGGPGDCPGPIAPSDTLRIAVRDVVADLPDTTPGLRLLVRPPVSFYLGGRVAVQIEPNLAGLLEPRDPRLWALVDVAQLRQEGNVDTTTARLMERWEKVREYPTRLNLPTLLDVDPGAARAGHSDDVNAPLWLLRPRQAGASR
jgi:4-amino-4-deoxy-L-arabinose transferase-like glycosyltransferase